MPKKGRNFEVQIQCTRCKGWFKEEDTTECVTITGEYLADLCHQCLNGWIEYEAFVEANE